MHNCKWPEAQISRNECCCNELVKIRKELSYRRIEINLEQYRCCSHYYSNLGALTENFAQDT